MLKPIHPQKTQAGGGIRERAEQNMRSQAALGREIGGLKPGPLKAAAETRMLALRTALFALNVEMRVRTDQQAGHS